MPTATKGTAGRTSTRKTNAPDPSYQHQEREAHNTFTEQQRIDRILRETQVEQHKDQLLQSVIEGAVVVVLTEFLLFGLALWSLPLLALVGAATGWVAHAVDAQRGMAALIAFGGLNVARLFAGLVVSYFAIIYFIVGICFFVAVRIPRSPSGPAGRVHDRAASGAGPAKLGQDAVAHATVMVSVANAPGFAKQRGLLERSR